MLTFRYLTIFIVLFTCTLQAQIRGLNAEQEHDLVDLYWRWSTAVTEAQKNQIKDEIAQLETQSLVPLGESFQKWASFLTLDLKRKLLLRNHDLLNRPDLKFLDHQVQQWGFLNYQHFSNTYETLNHIFSSFEITQKLLEFNQDLIVATDTLTKGERISESLNQKYQYNFEVQRLFDNIKENYQRFKNKSERLKELSGEDKINPVKYVESFAVGGDYHQSVDALFSSARANVAFLLANSLYADYQKAQNQQRSDQFFLEDCIKSIQRLLIYRNNPHQEVLVNVDHEFTVEQFYGFDEVQFTLLIQLVSHALQGPSALTEAAILLEDSFLGGDRALVYQQTFGTSLGPMDELLNRIQLPSLLAGSTFSFGVGVGLLYFVNPEGWAAWIGIRLLVAALMAPLPATLEMMDDIRLGRLDKIPGSLELSHRFCSHYLALSAGLFIFPSLISLHAEGATLLATGLGAAMTANHLADQEYYQAGFSALLTLAAGAAYMRTERLGPILIEGNRGLSTDGLDYSIAGSPRFYPSGRGGGTSLLEIQSPIRSGNISHFTPMEFARVANASALVGTQLIEQNVFHHLLVDFPAPLQTLSPGPVEAQNSDQRLRELERKWRKTKSNEDFIALVNEWGRVGTPEIGLFDALSLPAWDLLINWLRGKNNIGSQTMIHLKRYIELHNFTQALTEMVRIINFRFEISDFQEAFYRALFDLYDVLQKSKVNLHPLATDRFEFIGMFQNYIHHENFNGLSLPTNLLQEHPLSDLLSLFNGLSADKYKVLRENLSDRTVPNEMERDLFLSSLADGLVYISKDVPEENIALARQYAQDLLRINNILVKSRISENDERYLRSLLDPQIYPLGLVIQATAAIGLLGIKDTQVLHTIKTFILSDLPNDIDERLKDAALEALVRLQDHDSEIIDYLLASYENKTNWNPQKSIFFLSRIGCFDIRVQSLIRRIFLLQASDALEQIEVNENWVHSNNSLIIATNLKVLIETLGFLEFNDDEVRLLIHQISQSNLSVHSCLGPVATQYLIDRSDLNAKQLLNVIELYTRNPAGIQRNLIYNFEWLEVMMNFDVSIREIVIHDTLNNNLNYYRRHAFSRAMQELRRLAN